jgi:hypothetical protein
MELTQALAEIYTSFPDAALVREPVYGPTAPVRAVSQVCIARDGRGSKQ